MAKTTSNFSRIPRGKDPPRRSIHHDNDSDDNSDDTNSDVEGGNNDRQIEDDNNDDDDDDNIDDENTVGDSSASNTDGHSSTSNTSGDSSTSNNEDDNSSRRKHPPQGKQSSFFQQMMNNMDKDEEDGDGEDKGNNEEDIHSNDEKFHRKEVRAHVGRGKQYGGKLLGNNSSSDGNTSSYDSHANDNNSNHNNNNNNDSDSSSNNNNNEQDIHNMKFRTIRLRANVIPSLLFHSSGSSDIPNTYACPFNLRTIRYDRFTCQKQEDNMLHSLRIENENNVNSVIDGLVYVGLTSFCVQPTQEGNSLPMSSLLQPDSGSSFHAGPVTLENIVDGVYWLKGKLWRSGFTTEADAKSDVSTTIISQGNGNSKLEKGVSVFLRVLDEVMPKHLSRQDLVAFIQDHDWDSSKCWKANYLTEDPSLDVYQLQRFIYENLARHTEVLAHIIDGLHRMTGLELASVGFIYDDSEKQLIQEYANKAPHALTKIDLRYCIPKVLDEHLIQQMNETAASIQSLVGMQMPHTPRDNLNCKLHQLAAKCDEKKVPYLWDFLSVVYKVIEGVTPTDVEQELVKNGILRERQESLITKLISLAGKGKDTNKMPFINECISLWVQKMAQIISVSVDLHEAVTIPNKKDNITPEESRKHRDFCFMKPDCRNNDLDGINNGFHINPCHTKANKTHHFLKEEEGALDATGDFASFQSVFPSDRYFQKMDDLCFIMHLILLWSHICKETQIRLIYLCSSQPTRRQYHLGDAEDASRFIMNFFQSVIDSVSASYDTWKKVYFVSIKKQGYKNTIVDNPDQAIHLCLIEDALLHTSVFFSSLGVKPTCPDKLKDPWDALANFLRKKKVSTNYPDYNTFLVVSHAMGTAERKTVDNKGHKGRLVRHFKASDDAFSEGNEKHLKSYINNLFSNNTYGGAHPRGKNKAVIELVRSNLVVPNSVFVDEHLFTASVEQHESFVVDGIDKLFFNKLLTTKPVEEEEEDEEENEASDIEEEDDDEELEEEGFIPGESGSTNNNHNSTGSYEENTNNHDNNYTTNSYEENTNNHDNNYNHNSSGSVHKAGDGTNSESSYEDEEVDDNSRQGSGSSKKNKKKKRENQKKT